MVGLVYPSAFDRINVRRLFITIENAIKGAADAQLFEFNDASTRASFINIVEPYLSQGVSKAPAVRSFLARSSVMGINGCADSIDASDLV